MKNFVYFLLIVGNLLNNVAAENVNDLVVGAYYYVKGITSDDKVMVLDVNLSRGLAKVIDPDTRQVDLPTLLRTQTQ